VVGRVSRARICGKIESLGASGLDDTGEYSLATAPRASSCSSPTAPAAVPATHHVDGYTPMNLEDLVRLVSQRLSPLGNRQSPTQQ